MNKQIFIGTVVVGVLAVAGVFAYMGSNNSNQETTLAENQANTQMQAEGTEPDSLRALLGMTGNQKCTFVDAESNTEGTVYASNGQVRADVTSTTEGEQSVTHMITDSSDVYIWMDGEAQGFTMSLDTVTELADRFSGMEATGAGQPSALDPDKQVDFECMPWSADANTFTPPSTVEFQSFGDLMMGAFQSAMPEAMQGDNVPDACGACDSIPDAAAAEQCRQALSC